MCFQEIQLFRRNPLRSTKGDRSSGYIRIFVIGRVEYSMKFVNRQSTFPAMSTFVETLTSWTKQSKILFERSC